MPDRNLREKTEAIDNIAGQAGEPFPKNDKITKIAIHAGLAGGVMVDFRCVFDKKPNNRRLDRIVTANKVQVELAKGPLPFQGQIFS
jgi:hypothetical protein